MTSPILLTGGTGTLGRLVAPRLRDAGHRVRILSRGSHRSPSRVGVSADGISAHGVSAHGVPADGVSRDGVSAHGVPADGVSRDGVSAHGVSMHGVSGDGISRDGVLGDGVEFVIGDLATGDGIPAAVDGVEIVVHCAGSAKGDEDKARHLVRAASRAGVRHLVYISVVGADRVPVVSGADRAMFGYYAGKRAAERIVAESGLPWTTLRATQFHELMLTVAQQMAKMPVIPVPAGVRFQPVDAGEVAARLVELTLGRPSGLVPDLAGPRAYGMDELVRSYLRASHRRRLIMPIRLGGRAYRAIRAGANLAPDRAVGRRTWEDFLAERTHPGRRELRPPPLFTQHGRNPAGVGATAGATVPDRGAAGPRTRAGEWREPVGGVPRRARWREVPPHRAANLLTGSKECTRLAMWKASEVNGRPKPHPPSTAGLHTRIRRPRRHEVEGQ